jgi:hypothetical protein
MTVTPDQIPGILERHAKWLRSEPGGERANLSYSNLSCSNLSYSNLSYSNLSYSNLSGCNLRGARLSGSNLRGSDLRGSNLSRSDLSGSNLSGSNLSGSNLSGADLSGADLSGAVHAFASVSFLGHGECGRTLTAMRRTEGDAPVLQCGCFYGNQTELREFIADGPEKYRKTRTLALETVLALLDARNE